MRAAHTEPFDPGSVKPARGLRYLSLAIVGLLAANIVVVMVSLASL